MRLLKAFGSAILTPILDFIIPPICLTCNNDLRPGERIVCIDCWHSIEAVNPDDDFYEQFSSKLSVDGLNSRLISPFYFEKDSRLQSIIHGLKYEGFTLLGIMTGRYIGELIKEDEELSKAHFLIPVPLHSIKQRERGYNQAEFICSGIEEITGIRTRTDLLRRRKYTVSQTQLSIEERKENVGDAFCINEKHPAEISGKSFILVDDVITTGSTINACATELKKAGAAHVHAASVALAK